MIKTESISMILPIKVISDKDGVGYQVSDVGKKSFTDDAASATPDTRYLTPVIHWRSSRDVLLEARTRKVHALRSYVLFYF